MAANRLVAFHRWDDDPTIFLVGFVKEIGAEAIHFSEVDSCGRPDEEMLVPTDEIVWLDFETHYLLGLEILHPQYEKLVGTKPSTGVKATNTKAIRKALVAACDLREAISLKIDKDTFYAIPFALDGDFLGYTLLEDGGRPNGICWIRIDVIKELVKGTDRQITERYLFDRQTEAWVGKAKED